MSLLLLWLLLLVLLLLLLLLSLWRLVIITIVVPVTSATIDDIVATIGNCLNIVVKYHCHWHHCYCQYSCYWYYLRKREECLESI